MATRFVRIDLADEARDFRPIAIEPGVALLDRNGANAKVLGRWLGGLLAEPVWEGESVEFYIRDDAGGRLEDVTSQTASADDLRGLLKDDLTMLAQRIERAKPETSTERALKKTIQRCFQELLDNPHRNDLDNYFFRYRDVNGRWRLVWCWGYQRYDQEPATATVCTDPECGLLFVRRPGQSPKCPACEKALAAHPRKRRKLRTPALLALLLLLIAAAGWYWWAHPTRLVAQPDTWTGPVGSRIDFSVAKAGLFSKQDVSRQAVPVVLDPQVVRLDPAGHAVAVSPGKTLVRFHLGNMSADATLVVGPMKAPNKLTIEPRTIELGIGTTARPKVMGQFDDGSQADLTDAVQWSAEKNNVVYACAGLLEGISEGTSAVTASYRAAEGKPVDASATVTVAQIDFEKLEAAVDPSVVGLRRGSRLKIDAMDAHGKSYSVAESSMLTAQVTPPYLAKISGGHLIGQAVGSGKLAATFGDRLSAGATFDVVGLGIDRLTVHPQSLDLIVGQVADLSIAAPPGEAVRVTGDRSGVVEITAENRIIARSEGAASITVAQGVESRDVSVVVKKGDIAAIALDPTRLVVPVDDMASPRVMARIDGGRMVELSPDAVELERSPSPRYAQLQPGSLRVRGVRPTEPSNPQSLAVRLGNHQASSPVEVVVAPMRLTLLPAGPIDLPLGQMMRLSAWATYSGGRRVAVPGERLQWRTKEDAATVEGLELRGDRVASLRAGAGPLSVYASYFGRESNRVPFRAVEAGDVTLRLDVDRPVRLAGETGVAMLSAVGPKGAVELVPELASLKSSDEKVLAVDEKSGLFRAATPGKATVTASHPAAKSPAQLPLSVYDPVKARLVFDPSTVRLAVDQVAQLPLYLEVKDDARTERVPLAGPGVGYAVAQPQAVRWQAPWLTGLSPAKPFELSASMGPLLSSTATATVEVVPAEVGSLRVVPNVAAVAANQPMPLAVEAKLRGSDAWVEVRPEAVAWKVPSEVIWSPADAGLRPTATLAEGARGEVELQASFAGKQALALVRGGGEAPNAAAADARLVVQREPEGMFVPAGAKQRYTVMVERGGRLQPAADVVWTETYDNDFVDWQPPVLSAKRGGYEVLLRAEVGGRAALVRTMTYEPNPFERSMPRGDAPVAVKILSDQITGAGQSVRVPAGAEFDDFRVEAHYADGFTRVVTKKATLRTTESPDKAIVSSTAGRIVGVRPGKTAVSAEFDGVASQQPLPVEVTAALDIDEIRLAPSPVTMLRGESLALEAIGYKDGKSVGVITGMARLNWQSSNPQVVQANGPTIAALGLGQATVSAATGNVSSQPTAVNVVSTLADPLVVEPKVLRLRVGQSARLGTDVSVTRQGVDVSRQVSVAPVQPDVVRYDAAAGALVGVGPGSSAVTLGLGDKLTTMLVEVVPGFAPIDGTVVVEPSGAVLAPGQAIDMRVYVVTPAGQRIDRTESSVISSSDAGKVRLVGNKACAVATGSAVLTATLPGTQQTGSAVINVNNEEITQLTVDPPRAELAVGDMLHLRVLGAAASGTHELYPQPDLAVSAAGENPAAIRVVGPSEIAAVSEGQATASVSWKNRLNALAPVAVTNMPWSALTIEPAAAAIRPGETIAYQVSALRGGQRRVLGPESGLQLFTGNQQTAQSLGGSLVRGGEPGQTTVVAQVGSLRAETPLTVLSGAPAATDIVTGRPGYIIGERWRHGRWIGGRWVEPGGVVAGTTAPTAVTAGLRFVPDVVRLGAGSPAQGVRVVEVLGDGTVGRDVTADPQLELTDPPGVVKVEKTAAGPLLRPIGVGQTRVGARLGTLTADPLLVEVGDQIVGAARLEVAPNPLAVWSGEEGRLAAVTINPGGGQSPFPVAYKITIPPGQGILAPSGDQAVRGLAPGVTTVVVTAADAKGAYNGLSTAVTVEVGASDQLALEPSELALQVGQTAPPVSVVAVSPNGSRYQVPAAVQSADAAVLAPDATVPGRFVARGLGETQLRADYRGRTAFAKVVVSGKRFLDVQTSDPVGSDAASFDITIEVLAAESEGPLEYRVYGAGQPPAESWVPAQLQGSSRRVTLRSPRMTYGPRGSLYHLVVEARNPAGGPVEQYPLTFRLKEGIERLDRPK